jgi:hypothetical protein
MSALASILMLGDVTPLHAAMVHVWAEHGYLVYH